ncbi:hypothetical protein PRIPAC_87853 [Pristionchus pacificus]|uniref:Ribosomal protein n=1 Tax=Pristionchus pacificus TaxID=54126 RepID=A0A2A6B6E0_PRIPA|nr:hypothetical protein PRIPAC_87853 [Pristionchus pacificus]|eukprot:PDM61449.1 ribosomal protein [Pristionchus pacificus]
MGFGRVKGRRSKINSQHGDKDNDEMVDIDGAEAIEILKAVKLGDTLEFVLLLDGVAVGGFLGGVDQLVGQALLMLRKATSRAPARLIDGFVYDAGQKAVKRIAHFPKQTGKVKVPEWSDLVKLGVTKDMAPESTQSEDGLGRILSKQGRKVLNRIAADLRSTTAPAELYIVMFVCGTAAGEMRALFEQHVAALLRERLCRCEHEKH